MCLFLECYGNCLFDMSVRRKRGQGKGDGIYGMQFLEEMR